MVVGVAEAPVLAVALLTVTARSLDPSVLVLAPQSVSVISFQYPLLSSPAHQQSINSSSTATTSSRSTCCDDRTTS